MKNEEFLDFLHEVGKLAKPMHKDTLEKIPSLDTAFKNTEYDSLDMLVVYMYVCDVYGIDEETGKELVARTPKELLAFVTRHKTKDPQTVAEAVEGLL